MVSKRVVALLIVIAVLLLLASLFINITIDPGSEGVNKVVRGENQGSVGLIINNPNSIDDGSNG
tara:strand:- start:510 stop:701 length:192 start_codon:yes stop_codon:yes gene_type:complete